MNTIVRLFTIIFGAAVAFGLMMHPQLISQSLSGTASLVKATRGNA